MPRQEHLPQTRRALALGRRACRAHSWLAELTPALWLALGSALLLVQGCASLPPPDANAMESAALPMRADDVLGRAATLSVPAGMGSGVRALPQSDFSMDARLTLARHAQRSLDVQYYLLQNDVTGHALLRALRDAALRGVRVRLLIDDLYTAGSDRTLLALAAHPNVEVRLFNPFAAGRGFFIARWAFSLFDFARVNRRMHNKMFIADGAFAVAGGRNIADEYFFRSEAGNFIDFDLLIAGDAVPHMAAIFDSYWNSRRVYPLHALESGRDAPEAAQKAFEAITTDAAAAYPTPPANLPDMLGNLSLGADIARPPLRLLPARIEAFADSPEKAGGRSEAGEYESTVTHRVLEAMGRARSELDLTSPYFIPGAPGLEGLRQARARGVRISVVTNTLGSNDEPLASAAYARYRVPMLRLGVEIHEIDSRELKRNRQLGEALRNSTGRSHAKLVVIDRRTTFVGSMNLDLRSARTNTELGLLIESPALADQVLALAHQVRGTGSYHLRLSPSGGPIQWVSTEQGEETVRDSDPDVGLLIRLQTLLLSPFVSEGLL